MTTPKQFMLSGGLIAGALGVVAFGLLRDRDQETAAVAGHEHGAVSASPTGALEPVHLDAEAQRRIGVTFATVERRSLTVAVRAVGTVTYDETRLTTVSPKVEGWAERLYVDFTGKAVRQGEPLLELYSPALVSAQEELILARRLVDGTSDLDSRAALNAQDLLASARRRLSYWDVPADQIALIEESGVATKTIMLRAPASGIIIEKNVVEGTRIGPGMEVYRIADLTSVWVEAELFEKDLGLIELGAHAVINFEAYPGETFEGLVTYVYPEVTADARTGRMRLELANPALRFRPGMYATVELHPPTPEPVLVVPRSAVLGTGTRDVVFVSAGGGAFQPRLVTLGRSTADVVEILAGLAEGETVVASASFLIDAESNLGAAMPDAGAREDSAAPGGTAGAHLEHAPTSPPGR